MEETTLHAGMREAVHQAEIDAPADLLYDLIADATVATMIFPTTVCVEHAERGTDEEHLRIWAAFGDELRNWTSHRLLRPGARSVIFQQDSPEPPVAFMRGQWHFDPLGDDTTKVTLSHEYRAVGDSPDGVAWIEKLADRTSRGQLAALGAFAALGRPADARLSTAESAQLRCGPEAAYAFMRDPAGWPGLLPGLEHVSLCREKGDMQLFDLMVRDDAGSLRKTRLARVCAADGSGITFKDLVPLAPIAAHTGRWRFDKTPGGTRVRVEHHLAVTQALDPGPARADDGARTRILEAVGAPTTVLLNRMREIS